MSLAVRVGRNALDPAGQTGGKRCEALRRTIDVDPHELGVRAGMLDRGAQEAFDPHGHGRGGLHDAPQDFHENGSPLLDDGEEEVLLGPEVFVERSNTDTG